MRLGIFVKLYLLAWLGGLVETVVGAAVVSLYGAGLPAAAELLAMLGVAYLMFAVFVLDGWVRVLRERKGVR